MARAREQRSDSAVYFAIQLVVGVPKIPVTAAKKLDRFSERAEAAAATGRPIQKDIDGKEKSRANNGKAEKGAMQAGARRYPEPPFPHQHLKKPETEADLDLAPMYDAPHYKGSEKLQGKWR